MSGATRGRRSPRQVCWAAVCVAFLGCAAVGCSDPADGDSTGEGSDSSVSADVAVDVGQVTADSTLADTGAVVDVKGPADVAPAVQHLCSKSADCANLPGVDRCAGKLFCDKTATIHVCKVKPGTAVVCPTNKDTACVTSRCDPLTGSCVQDKSPAGTPCVDDDPCTVDSSCKDGVCVAGATKWCDCSTTKDCAALEDGNACNGTLYCDAATFPAKCRVNPASVIKCADVNDTACSKNACDKKLGKCAMKPVLDGTPCDDGKKATIGDQCKAGKCAEGLTPPCKKHSDCAVQEDGDLCNGTLFCDVGSGACKVNPATVITCPSAQDTACTKNSCDAETGACNPKAVQNGSACSDDDKCTAGDVCIGGACKSGKDVCPCSSDKDCLAEEDGNACNGTLFCNKATSDCELNPATLKVCASVDDTACTKNACVPASAACTPTVVERVNAFDCGGDSVKTGVKGAKCRYEVKPKSAPSAKDPPCEDGDKCTKAETCAGGTCGGGVFTCVCTSNVDCLKEEDGNLCNGTLYCDKTLKHPACKLNPATVVKCPALLGKPCQVNACLPHVGLCQPAPIAKGKPCDDDDKCTVGDFCEGGLCKALKKKACDDGDLCTLDTCAPGSGCLHKPKTCDDGNTCTVDACHKKTGQCTVNVNVADATGCNADNNGCTVNDACFKGVCKSGVKVSCTGKTGPCEDEVCAPKGINSFQCIKTPRKDGSACDDGVACTVGEACKDGKCAASGKEALFVRDYATDGMAVKLRGVTTRSGGYAVAGVRLPGLSSGSTPTGIWVAGIDAEGSLAWSHHAPIQALPKGAQNADIGAAGIVPVAGGRLGVVGTTATNAGELELQALVFDADGKKLVGTVLPGAKGGYERARTLRAFPGGGMVAAGMRTLGGESDGLVARLTASASVVWTRFVGKPGTPERFDGAVVAATGTMLLAGQARPAASIDAGWLVALDAAGKVGWQVHHKAAISGGATASKQAFTGVALTSSGAVAVGWAEQASKRLLWTVAVDSQGKLVWQKTDATAFEAADIIRRAGDELVIAGTTRPAPGTADTRVFALDSFGNVQWDITRDLGTSDGALGLLGLGDGALAVVGSTTTKTGERGVLMRLDPWGRSSCKASGVCSEKALKDCADATPCTRDRCDPKAGCVHDAPPGRNCEAKDGCSQRGVCKAMTCGPSPEGKLWAKTIDAGAIKEVLQVSPDGDGALVSARTTKGELALVRLDRFGALRSAVEVVKNTDATEITGAVAVFDGGYITAWRDKAGKTWAARFGPTGNEIWKRNLCSPTDSSPDSFGQGQHDWRDWFPECRVQSLRTTPGGTSVVVSGQLQGYKLKYFNKVTANHIAKYCVFSRTIDIADGLLHKVAAGGHFCGGYQWFRRPSGKTVVSAGPMVYGSTAQGLVGGDSLAFGRCRGYAIGKNGVSHGSWCVAIGRIHASGVEVWTTTQPASSSDRLNGAVQAPDGGFVLVGAKLDAGIPKDWMMRLDAAGKLMWSVSRQFNGQMRLTSVLNAVGGGYTTVGERLHLGTSRLAVAVVDSGGAPVTETLVSPAGFSTSAAAVVPFVQLSDFGSLIAGGINVAGKARLLAVRANAWSQTSCTEAGQCAAKTWKDCADGNICTTDGCDPKKGCKAIAWTCKDELPCTTDECDPKKGCFHGQETCDDKNACTVDACIKGKGCKHDKVVCKDGNPCTVDTCSKATGCVFAGIADGKLCAGCGGMVCQGKACKVGDATLAATCGAIANPGQSCKEIQRARPKATDGTYWIDPDGLGGVTSVKVFCDMLAGGWTRVDETTAYKSGAYCNSGCSYPFTYPLSDKAIDALKAVSTHARQSFSCGGRQTSAPHLLRWDKTLMSPTGQPKGICSGGNLPTNHSGSVEEFDALPLRRWYPRSCANSKSFCAFNVGHAYFR